MLVNDKSTLESGLNIICVGNVFNSWDLLKSGFVQILSKHLKNFRLLKLKQSSAYGAAKYAAKQGANFDLSIGETTELLFSYSATSTGYLANGQHVSANGPQTNGIHRNGHTNGNGATNRIQQERRSDDQSPSVTEKLLNSCSVI